MVLIVKEMLSKDEMNLWVNLFLEKDLQVFKAPSLQKLRDTDLDGSIRNLQIEDLLNRKPIKIEIPEYLKFLIILYDVIVNVSILFARVFGR